METGVFTVFYKTESGFSAGESEQMECPAGFSELALRLSAANAQTLSENSFSRELSGFFRDVWYSKIVPAEGIAAASFSCMGCTYWIAMSCEFFVYAKKNGILTVPAGFKYGSASGQVIVSDCA